ncbi:MAG TPA: histidine phosphatase family protein [Allosphingosinicella sp.]|jgi:probable phosphoglycerate mutase
MKGASWFIARHGETVFNAVGRIQGDAPHTPLTRAGFAQADAIGAALRARLGEQPELTLWSSPAGRALQTLALICEHLELDWHQARIDPRLREMEVGEWSGRYYRDVVAEARAAIEPGTGLFGVRPPGGEGYDEVAARLQNWIDETAGEEGDRLIVMHGMSSRVLRGLLTGLPFNPPSGASVAPGLPQGSVVEIVDGSESVLALGQGRGAS